MKLFHTMENNFNVLTLLLDEHPHMKFLVRSNALIRDLNSLHRSGESVCLTIITRARVGVNHTISNKRELNNCFIKNNGEILLDLANFALQEQPENKSMIAISQAWCNA